MVEEKDWLSGEELGGIGGGSGGGALGGNSSLSGRASSTRCTAREPRITSFDFPTLEQSRSIGKVTCLEETRRRGPSVHVLDSELMAASERLKAGRGGSEGG